MGDLQAVQHIRKMRGGSQSHLIRASDNNYYVVKFTNNPQCKRVLANEYLASRLGELLGLPIPEANIITVSDWLIENTPELRVENAGMSIPVRSGQQLAIRYVVDPLEHSVFDYLPESLTSRIQNIQDFSRVLVLDKWACNCDGRQAVFWKPRDSRHYRTAFIDQGYLFNAGEWTSALRGVYARNCVYERITGWHDFEPTLSRAEAIETSQLFEIAKGLPIEWWAETTTAELTRLIYELFNRRSKIRELILAFKDSTRNPFPNWI